MTDEEDEVDDDEECFAADGDAGRRDAACTHQSTASHGRAHQAPAAGARRRLRQLVLSVHLDYTKCSCTNTQTVKVCVQSSTAAIDVTLFAFAVECRAACAVLLRRRCCRTPAMQQLIDISWPTGPQQQTRCKLFRQTDGHRPLDTCRPCGILCEQYQ